MNAKYQMYLRLWELVNPSNPPLYPPILINVDTLNKSAHNFSDYLKTEVIKSYIDVCIMGGYYVCVIKINSSCLFVPLLTCLDCLHYVESHLQLFLFINNSVRTTYHFL